jgi:phosphoglycolate phosphatase-like HAD superfamily hydrolase
VTRLVLWDIDGTLVDAAGFGWQIVQQAYQELCGSPLTVTIALAGRTDRAIFLEALAANGRDEQELPALCRRIGELAEQQRDAMVAQGGRVLPGAAEAVTALAGQPGVRQSVLSGNLRATGVVKLTALGLIHQLDLGLAAFGDDHVVRADLVDVARERYAARNGSGPAPHVVLIGDTPLDVAAARESGAGIVAAATGHYSATELEEAGAPIVLPDLTDTGRIVDAVMRA